MTETRMTDWLTRRQGKFPGGKGLLRGGEFRIWIGVNVYTLIFGAWGPGF